MRSRPRPRAVILVTGDEVLRGRIRERNAGLLARSLEAAGVAVERVEILGDDLDALVSAIRSALDGGVDLLCTTGGLGPTHDDLTMEAVAAATGRPLALDAAALAMVEARSLPLAGDPEVARAVREKQASLPAGATVLPPVGTAPGRLSSTAGPSWSCCPGLLGARRDVAGPRRAAGGAAPGTRRRHRRARAAGPRDPGVARGGRPAPPRPRRLGLLGVGICARDAELEITVRSAVGDAWAADALEERLAAEFGPALYSRDGATLDEVVARGLLGAGQTVAVAESCTGGGLGARLTARSGSSAYVLGGVISYADEVKRDVLGSTPRRSAGTGPSRRRSPSRWPPACAPSSAATGRSRSPASRGPAVGAPRSPSASSTWASPGPAASRRGSTACGATGSGSGRARRPSPSTPCGGALDAREEV